VIGNDKQLKRRPLLRVLDDLLTPQGECLRSGYAYLIRSSVRMPELYPLLGELLFGSKVDNENGKEAPPNVVGLFVEDSLETLMAHLVGPDRYLFRQNEVHITTMLDPGIENQTAAWLDTFGTFQEVDSNLTRFKDREEVIDNWWQQSIAGPGNPMAILRFFRLAQEKAGDSAMNVFLLSSLSNLYRNLGLAEAAAFLKTMLNESIWAVVPELNHVPKETRLRETDGLFLAVLQESVLELRQANYLESFFDGIIHVSPCILDDKWRAALVHVQTLPEIVEKRNDFAYLPSWKFKNGNEPGLTKEDWPLQGTYVRSRLRDDRIAIPKEAGAGQ